MTKINSVLIASLSLIFVVGGCATTSTKKNSEIVYEITCLNFFPDGTYNYVPSNYSKHDWELIVKRKMGYSCSLPAPIYPNRSIHMYSKNEIYSIEKYILEKKIKFYNSIHQTLLPSHDLFLVSVNGKPYYVGVIK